MRVPASQSACHPVGRLDALHSRKGPQRRPPLRQPPAQPRGLAVWAVLPTPQQPPQPRLERDQSPLQLLSVALAGSEAVPEREEPLDLRQAPATNRCRRSTAVDQRLEVALEVRITQGAAVAGARPTADWRACGGHNGHTATPSSGTQSRAPPVGAVPLLDVATPGHGGGRRVQETAADNAGTAPARPPRPRPPVRSAATRGTPLDVPAGRPASGRRAAISDAPGPGGNPRKAAGRSSLSSGPAGLPAPGLARARPHSRHAGRHSPPTGQRSPVGVSLPAPGVRRGRAPAPSPTGRAPAATSSRSCRCSSALPLLEQARRGVS